MLVTCVRKKVKQANVRKRIVGTLSELNGLAYKSRKNKGKCAQIGGTMFTYTIYSPLLRNGS